MPIQDQQLLNKKKAQVVLRKFYENPVAKFSLELFLSISLISFFSLFAIRPTLVTITELIAEIETKEELLQQLHNKSASLSTAQEVYQRLQSEVVLLDQAIPSQPGLINSLKILEKIAGEENIIIESATLQEIPDEGSTTDLSHESIDQAEIYLNLRVMGSYPSIRNYISQLKDSRRKIIVESIGFQVDERITQRNLKADLLVRIPYFGDKDAKSI